MKTHRAINYECRTDALAHVRTALSFDAQSDVASGLWPLQAANRIVNAVTFQVDDSQSSSGDPGHRRPE